jgi:cell division protein FtsB
MKHAGSRSGSRSAIRGALPRATIRALPSAPTQRKPRPETALEGAAAEFALLAQRRARLRRQIDLLARQAAAAEGMMAQLEARMATLGRRIAELSPGAPAQLREDAPPSPSAASRRRSPLQY